MLFKKFKIILIFLSKYFLIFLLQAYMRNKYSTFIFLFKLVEAFRK